MDDAAPRLETERLILRGWRDADRGPFAELNRDRRVMEHFPAPLTREQSDVLIDRVMARFAALGWGLWAVERRDDAAFLGFAGLAPMPDGAPLAGVEIGWRLARHAWGRGFATEAALAVAEFAFHTLALDELLSLTSPGNVRSRRVMEKLGMTRDPADDFDHPRIPAGHPLRRQVLYRLSRAAWAARRGPGSG